MNCLRRSLPNCGPRPARRRSSLAVVSLVTLFVVAAPALVTDAAPVTLQFDAIVGPPNTVSPFDVPFSLPFSYQQGDTLTGTITVEPLDVSSSTSSTFRVESLLITFSIGGTSLVSSKYSIEVWDNVLRIDGAPLPHDDIVIGCSPLAGPSAVCSPNTVGDMENILWGFSMTSSAPSGVLDGADIPGDPAIWSAFNRGINMSFRQKSGPGIMRLRATVGPFLAVPESGNIAASALGLAICAAISPRRR